MARRARSRARRVVVGIVASLGALLVAVVVGVLIWSQVGVLTAEPGPLAAVRDDARLTITDTDAALVLAPSDGTSDVGLVFLPGGKVDPSAYAAKLSRVVATKGITVVITKPTLNLAFFDLRPLDAFTKLAPGVDTWMVGGHSLGGVRACQLATDADALVLFASYCATDLAESGLPVLSLAGEHDGLSTPAKIAEARPLLPADAEVVEIDGANHASFGDYGAQSGDGVATISDAEMTDALTRLVSAFAANLATR